MQMGQLIRRLIGPGSYILFLLFLTGIWLTISPFVMTSQTAGQHWIASTVNNVIIGAILIVISLLGILSYMVFALRDILREAQARRSADREATSS